MSLCSFPVVVVVVFSTSMVEEDIRQTDNDAEKDERENEMGEIEIEDIKVIEDY